MKKNERLKEALEFLGFSHSDLRDKLEYKTTQKITDLISGKQHITDSIALDFEKAFNLNKCWLLFGEGSMFSDKNLELKLLQEQTHKQVLLNKIAAIESELSELKKLI